MSLEASPAINGKNLIYSFRAGATRMLADRDELNRINVFPVKDGDTGANFAATVTAVLNNVRPERSYKLTIDSIARNALIGARGNSGIIFAQWLYGVSNETPQGDSITLKQFAESIKASVKYTYESVANPVEGTMLTIIKDWADSIWDHHFDAPDFTTLMQRSLDKIRLSLEKTKEQLEVLRKNNVVDAGAKAFVLFIEGIIDLLITGTIRKVVFTQEKAAITEMIEEIPGDINFRYCTEAIIKGTNITKELITQAIDGRGDSLVVAGSDSMRRIHIHTNSPSDVMRDLLKLGTIPFQKVDDMVRQNEAVASRKWNIALVTDSACDLPGKMMDNYQMHMLPVGLQFGENNFLDKYTIVPETFYSMLNSGNAVPTSSQVNQDSFEALYVKLAAQYDSIIAVNLSSKLSGTYNSSFKAAKKVEKETGTKISVIDSRNISGAEGLIALRVAKAIEQGLDHDEIVKKAEDWVKNTRILVSVKTLKYMVRSGRVSHAKGFIASALNLNPIVSVDEEGKSQLFDKTIGQKANLKKVLFHVKKITEGRSDVNYIILHANNREGAASFAGRVKEIIGTSPVAIQNISPVIGMHAGVGVVAVALDYN